jgi:hypothetical protein
MRRDLPVVAPPRPSQFLDRRRQIARVQQQAVHIRNEFHGLGNRLLARHVNDLHQRDAGQGRP